MLRQERKGQSLAEAISGILNTAPSLIDPEDDGEDTKAKVTEGSIEDEDEEILLSKFRKQNVDFLEDVDSKYAGKKGSRKSLKDSDEDWTTDDEIQNKSSQYKDDNSVEDYNSNGNNSDDLASIEDETASEEDYNNAESEEEDDNTGSEEEEDDNIESEEGEDSTGSEGQEDAIDSNVLENDNFKPLNNTDVDNQIEKGACVRNQLNIWESLLEMRIQLQKCLITANKMPQQDTFKEIKTQSSGKFGAKVNETKRNVENVLNKLLQLQLLLLKQYPETKKLFSAGQTSNSNKDDDEEIPSDTEDENEEETEAMLETPNKKRKLSDFETDIKNKHDTYNSYRNSVIHKWNDRTRIAVVNTSNPVHSVLNQIDHILNDKQKLIKRTQTKRSKYEIIGKSINSSDDEKMQVLNQENDVEIFDDNDFYHQLLRELIEAKSADVTDPVRLGRQWIQLQNMRSKMKRNIDTRATKGRKIRYTVHTKLVNFMAAIDNGYTEGATTDLYNSLFGKNQANKA